MACVSCGGRDEPCCAAQSCEEGLGCDADLKCVPPVPPDPTPAPAGLPPASHATWIFIAAGCGVLLALVLLLVWRSHSA